MAAPLTTEFGKVVANGGRFCDQSQFDMPFRSDFKMAGSMPLPYGVNFGAVFQNYPGTERVITWSPPASVFPGGRTNSETIILSTPGTIFQPRYNQVDINFRKNFRHGSKMFTAQFDLFNVTNSASILTTNNAIGGSLGESTSILKGRMPRIAFQMRFSGAVTHDTQDVHRCCVHVLATVGTGGVVSAQELLDQPIRFEIGGTPGGGLFFTGGDDNTEANFNVYTFSGHADYYRDTTGGRRGGVPFRQRLGTGHRLS